MDNIEYRQVSYIMLDLIAAVIENKAVPDGKLDPAGLDRLFQVADKNGLTALTAFALEKAGYTNEEFKIAHAKAQRKNILFDKEYRLICDLFDKNEIRYLPLKGIHLKHLYPSPCLREMADMDILFDGPPEKVKSVLQDLGYACTQYDKSNHDVYQKAPYFCVEMHRSLADGSILPKLHQYFCKMSYTFSDSDSLCMQMTKEQMYLHLIAHAYIHDTLAGTGLRTLLDLNLYLKAYASQLDTDFIRKELAAIDLSEYESTLRNLSEKLFRYHTMSAEEKALLDSYIFAGKYGNHSRYIHNRIDRIMTGNGSPSKARYVAKRLSYNRKNIENSPFYSKHPKLAPLLYITRPINAVFTRPKKILEEIKQLKKK